jgi:hypothetical protein
MTDLPRDWTTVDEIKDVVAPGWREKCLSVPRGNVISRKECFQLLSVVTGVPVSSVKIAYRDARLGGVIGTSYQRGVNAVGLSENDVVSILLFTMIKFIGVSQRHKVEGVGFDLGLARGRVFALKVPGPLSRQVTLTVPRHVLDCENVVARAWERMLSAFVDE